MGFLRERVSYLKGLCEGMKLDANTNEGKLLTAIIDVIDDIALAVEDLEEIQDEHAEIIENIDQDLAEVESVIYDDEYYDDDKKMMMKMMMMMMTTGITDVIISNTDILISSIV